MTKILVIEDEAQTRDILVESLEVEGFDTICAENGRVGVKKAQEYLPDLVICDILMPELDGYGVLTTLRQNFLTEKIPVIFLTARTTNLERYYGMDIGANAYVTKPCTVEGLLAAIAKVCGLCTTLKSN
ncbi:response regulator transcription factor [aff. Roholtiella sp. LEGE 12411]|uniref:response regulator transcription factor n=1 Tax=aff. Roholtiella sp. LEGE 12411 TaxID=1828822 RepID=UPI00188066A6|nr:response regulator [aff. Roholtiella sp. LEGE 12411]MBE9035820.1 response regulator [aff. Roholtiella sp. LEGE 12411]